MNSSACSKTERKEWHCSLCDQTFRWRRHYDRHVEGHRNNDCKLCNALLTRRKQHVLHMLEQHNTIVKDGNLKCEYCDKRFEKKLVLYNHYKREHAGGLTVCMECGALLKTREEEALHKEKHLKEKPWKCKQCKKSFSRRQQYLQHLQGHEKYQCDTCGASFSTKLQLVDHNRDVHQDQSMVEFFACYECDKSFPRRCLLEEHYLLHSGEELLYCKDCNKNFRTTRGYKRHLTSSTHLVKTAPDEVKKYKCDKCRPTRTFLKKDILIKHLRLPHSYKCDLCDFTSTSKENTKRHQTLHTEGRKFVCDQCGVAFFNLTNLQDHFRYVHSEERDFQCSQCSKTFKTNSTLNRHFQSHSDDRPHKCHCGQSYKRSTHLRRHQDSTHGPTPRPKKIQRLARNEEGELVPIVEEKKPKKVKQTNPVPTTKDSWNNTDNHVLSLMVNDSGQVVTIQQLQLPENVSLAPHCSQSYDNDVMNSINVSYNLDFTTSNSLNSVPSTEPQLVFTTLEPPQQNIQLLDNILENDVSLKHSEHIFMREDMDGNLSSVLLDSNTDMRHMPLESCLMDQHQMMGNNGDIMFSCHDENAMISSQMPGFPSDDGASYLDDM